MGYVPHPTQVEYKHAEGILAIEFSDGLEREHPVALLRGYCPCAHCQGHGAGPPKWNPIKTPAALRIEDIHQVGTYAMCIVWGDGHDTGIFAFDYLRALVTPPDFDPDKLEAGERLDIEFGH